MSASSDGVGAWAATGERMASVTIVFHEVDEALALESTSIARVTVEVSADGQGFTAPYTIEFVGPHGTASGELGPGTATGTRIVVEAMGTPEMTFGEFFAANDGAPAATPAT